MRIGIPRERGERERRVAVTPKAARVLADLPAEVAVERGAGAAAGFPDDAYREAGAEVVDDAAAASAADVLARIGPPDPEEVDLIPEGAVLVGFLTPFHATEALRRIRRRRLTALAFEAMPRTTLAQSMDAMSSQAAAAGYAAVLVAADTSPKFFPMLTTAAGTIPPAKVLVLGAGVAGLQAIATAKRLGAVVSANDIRPEVQEQIESLGARFVAAEAEAPASTDDGYAEELEETALKGESAALAPHVEAADVVVTTAAVPGRPAPLLVTADMVDRMPPGAVIVDLAAATGGNCEVTRPDERVERGGVTVLGPTEAARLVAHDASEMYARNVRELLGLVIRDGAVSIDLDDEIIAGCCVIRDGEARHPLTREALEEGHGS